MDGIWKDLIYGIRSLMRSPGYAAATILVLGLGIGACSTAFTLGNSLFLRPLPVADPKQLTRIYTRYSVESSYFTLSYPDYRDIQALDDIFSGVLVDKPIPLSLGLQDHKERIWGYAVSSNYFSVLGVKPALGRSFLTREPPTGGREPVVVLSHGFWEGAFGARPEILGQSISLNGHPFTVVGVTPREFHGTNLGLCPDLWVPLEMEEWLTPGLRTLDARGSRGYFSMGRLKRGVDVEAARARVGLLARQLQRAHPDTNRGLSFVVLPEAAGRLHPMVRGAFLSFSGIVVLVVSLMFLLACANVAGLMLTRAASRQQEIAVRLAVGASRYRIIRQMLVESLLLSLAGGAVGLIATTEVTRLVSSFHLPTDRPLFLELPVDPGVIAFSLCVTILTAALFGLAPAVGASRPDLIRALKGIVPSAGSWRSPSRAVLVAGQIALSTVLLFGASLLLRSLQDAGRVDLGFDPKGVAMMSLDPQLQGYDADGGGRLWARVLDEISTLPKLASTGLASAIPLDLNIVRTSVTPEGRELPPSQGRPSVDFASVDGGYFQTMRIPLLEGRVFEREDEEESRGVVIVNEVLARRFWPGGSPVGKRLVFGKGEIREVIGVVKTGKYLTLGEEPRPYLYLPLHRSNSATTLVLRTRGNPGDILGEVRRRVERLDPALPIYNVKTMEEHLGLALLPARAGAILLGVFGGLALCLASVGLYGTLAYAVRRRTFEIGIRRALGAQDREILGLVIRQALPLIGGGLAVGLVVSLGASRVMRIILYGVSPTDLLAVAAAVVVLGSVALVACALPAYQAARIHPMDALRCE